MNCQAIADVMYHYVKAEEHRSHDPLAHHWLDSLGFQVLMTDMAAPVPGAPMAATTTLSTQERLDYRETKQAWESYFKLDMTLKELMATYGKKLALVAPENGADAQDHLQGAEGPA